MEYQKELSTAAPASSLWEAIVNLEAWPTLTASMREVRRLDAGPLRVGSAARVRQPGMAPATWTVTHLEPGRCFTWESRSPGVTTVADHEIESVAGVTRLVLRLRQRGPLSPVIGGLLGRRIRRFVDLEAAGFVTAAEAGAASA